MANKESAMSNNTWQEMKEINKLYTSDTCFNNIKKKVVESVEQDQTALMYRLVLIYMLRKIIPMAMVANGGIRITGVYPKRQILDFSKLKDIADDNFKFDENDRKFSKRVEYTAGKREIARYEQFLVFPQCFIRFVLQTRKNQGLFGKGMMWFISKIFIFHLCMCCIC